MKKLVLVTLVSWCLISCSNCVKCNAIRKFYHSGIYDSTIYSGVSDYCGQEATEVKKYDSTLFYPNEKDSSVYFYLSYTCFK